MERNTRQRDAILAAIMAAGRPLSPAEVLAAAQQDVAGLGMATVYRNLKALVTQGVVQSIELPRDGSRYEMAEAAHDHHHHFRCEACGRVFDIEGCPGDLARLAPKGFVVDHHEVTLYGRCGECVAPAP